MVRTVFDAARNRVRFIFSEFENVTVSFSGGKDSTCLYYLCLWEAERIGRRFELMFLDQEAEYQSTIDIVESAMSHPLVSPRWYQVPMMLTNATSHQEEFLHAWEEGADWVREKSKIAIHSIEEDYPQRFYKFFPWLEKQSKAPTAHLVGLRTFESMSRQRTMLKENGYKHYAWSTKASREGSYRFYPIWDFQFKDVWKMIADHDLPYNRVYDQMIAKSGVNFRTMRVSNLIHEQAFRSLASLHEFEPDTYDRLARRLGGVHCAANFSDEDFIYDASKLPKAFKNWRKYRDHVLASTPTDHIERYKKRFAKQPQDERVYQHQVKQMLLNDWEGKIPRTSQTVQKIKEIWWNRL